MKTVSTGSSTRSINLLKGTSGRVTLETDEFGRPIPFGQQTVVKAAQPGLNLELTLDSYLQYVTESALAEQVTKFHALDGTAIVMDPWTGEVLAMANIPKFDPNHSGSINDSATSRSRGYGRVRTWIDIQARHRRGRARIRQSDAQSTRFPARETLQVGGHVIHNADDDMPDTGRDRNSRSDHPVLAQRRRGRSRHVRRLADVLRDGT